MTIFCSKKLSALLSRTTSKHDETFIALIAFILLERKTNLSGMKNFFCGIIMLSENNNILEFN